MRLCVLVDDLEPGGKAEFWLRMNILQQAGLGKDEFMLGEGQAPTPLLLMCDSATKDRLLPYWLGIKGIGNYAGHIEKRDRWIGATFHPSSILSNPNLLPVCLGHLSNLLRAASNPASYVSW